MSYEETEISMEDGLRYVNANLLDLDPDDLKILYNIAHNIDKLCAKIDIKKASTYKYIS